MRVFEGFHRVIPGHLTRPGHGLGIDFFGCNERFIKMGVPIVLPSPVGEMRKTEKNGIPDIDV